MRRLLLCSVLLLGACETPAPQPAPAAPAPAPAAAPVRPADAPPATAPVTPPEAAEPTPTGPVEVAVAQGVLPERVVAEQIEKTFRLHQRYFSRAYRDRLHANSSLAGTVAVTFTIRPDGTVEGAQLLESTTRDATFDARITTLVGQMNFPPARGPTAVARYPVVFTPPPPRGPVPAGTR